MSLTSTKHGSRSTQAGPVRITFYFIRHGFSRSNCVKRHKRLGLITHPFIRDTPLTTWAIEHMPVHESPDVDILCCSSLLRAIQTSILLYQGQKMVHVLPYLKERPSISPENQPRSMQKQLEHFKPLAQSKIDYRYLLQEEDDASSPSKFIKWMSSHIPLLLHRHHLLSTKKRHIRIGIVTHKNWIKALTKLVIVKNIGQVRVPATWSHEKGLVLSLDQASVVYEGIAEPKKDEKAC